jgi:ribosomal protein L37E
MRWLVWWFRSLFCAHSFEREEARVECHQWDGGKQAYTVVSATCTKCGWHRSYRKFAR